MSAGAQMLGANIGGGKKKKGQDRRAVRHRGYVKPADYIKGKGQEFVQDQLGKLTKKLPKIKFQDGGPIYGPGSETSDSIPARLSDGEFVVKASAVRGLGQQMGGQNPQQDRRKGVKFLDSLQEQMGRVGERRGEMKKFKDGGEAYVRPKKAFAEAIGHSGEAQFKDKALKDAKKGGSKRRFITHYAEGGKVSFKDVIKARNKKEQDDEINIDDLDWWVESVTD